MNILFDFLTASVKTGAGEYLRRVFFEFVDRKNKSENVRVYALWDSRKGIAYEDLRPEILSAKYNVAFLDCAAKDIPTLVGENLIDRFFISCAHYVGDYPSVAQVKCEVVCVIHDCYAEELTNDHIYDYWLLGHGAYDFSYRFALPVLDRLRNYRATWRLARRFFHARHGGEYDGMLAKLKPIVRLLKDNPRAHLIVPSEFTLQTVRYHFGLDMGERARVFYSPERVAVHPVKITDAQLADLANGKTKYLLMVSANREAKNPIKLLRAFERFQRYNKQLKLVMIGYMGRVGENVILLPFLSDTDLDAAFRNCYALVYPSYFEGFGYPPLEVMRYGKPVLAANVSSIPEVLGNAPIYFSPFYDADIFAAMMKLVEGDYEGFCKRSRERYCVVRERQERDLKSLIAMLLDPPQS